MHRQPQNQRVYTSTFCAWRSHACCSCPLSISQDTRVLFTARRWNSGRADKLTEHVSFKRMAIAMPENSAVLLPHKNCVKSDIYRGRWRGLWKTMNPKLIREKDVSNLLTWKYSLSNKRPLVVRVYFVALKTANGQARQSKSRWVAKVHNGKYSKEDSVLAARLHHILI